MTFASSVACTGCRSLKGCILAFSLRRPAVKACQIVTFNNPVTRNFVGISKSYALSCASEPHPKLCTHSLRAEATFGQSGSGGMHTNRLAKEESPYLLQHSNNPVSCSAIPSWSMLEPQKGTRGSLTQVDWYPWGEEAFAKASSEDKPIFLSVGYR